MIPRPFFISQQKFFIMQTQMNLKTTTPPNHIPFSVWEMYIQTMNFPIRETKIECSFYFRIYPKHGVIDINPFFLIQGSFTGQIVDHIQSRTGKHFPDLGQNEFEAITVNNQTFVIVNRHLLMDSIMKHRVTNLNTYLKPKIFRFASALFWLSGGGHQTKTMTDTEQNEIIQQLSIHLENRIIKSLDV